MAYRIAGIDVHKRMLAVVVADVEGESEYRFERRQFGTTPDHLRLLSEWFVEQEVEEVVMESTAQYWKPVWGALERYWKPTCQKREGASPMSGTLHLAQAQSNRGPRGRKKDFPDAERLVKRLVSQELTLSFVPDTEQRLWRTVMRRKYQLTCDRVQLQNRLESLLEETHIKLSSLVSDLLGLSARRMLQALADGETNPTSLAALADKKLRATPAQLCDALSACTELNPVYRRLLKMVLEELQFLEQQIVQLEQEMASLLSQHQEAVQRLAEVPGLGVASAQQIIFRRNRLTLAGVHAVDQAALRSETSVGTGQLLRATTARSQRKICQINVLRLHTMRASARPRPWTFTLMKLEIENVSKIYRGSVQALRSFRLELGPGVLGLLGPNGAGKSTLMRILTTITQPSTGRVLWNGTDINHDPDTVRVVLGYLPQDFGIYPNLSAVEFLGYLAAVKGLEASSARRRIGELLELVNLTDAARRPLGGFSGGMRQRVGIAQALLNDPKLLIVDEPTAGLDPEERVRFRNLLSELSGERIVILSTHIVSDVEAVATDIALIAQGQLVVHGVPEALLAGVNGKVWEVVVSSGELAALRQRHLVSNTAHRADGVHARIITDAPPGPRMRVLEPSLEDAYLAALAAHRTGEALRGAVV